jgi:hypothetical protein
VVYLTQKRYRLTRSILYDGLNTNALYAQIIYPDILTRVGRYKRLLPGTFWAQDKLPLRRAEVLSPYNAGDTTLFVNNPHIFAVGDPLYEIGSETPDLNAEKNAIENATAQLLGTITAIDASQKRQTTRITPAAIADGDTYTFEMAGLPLVVTVDQGSTLPQFLEKIQTTILRLGVGNNIVESLEFDFSSGTYLDITAKEIDEIFKTTGSVSGTGTLSIQVVDAVGQITITPDAGNNNQNIGAKIGRIDQYPVGIITQDHIFEDDDGIEKGQNVTIYDRANIYRDALPYLDGQIVRAVQQLKYQPMYGSP